jgi:ABC-2 type transport system ATP-binding protein
MNMEKPVIEIKNLTKKYGSLTAVDNLSLTVKKGELFGFLGPNGAGKTTTIRTCLGLLNKNAGDVKIFGMDSHKDSVKIRAKTGYLPGDFGLIPDIKVKTFLKYFLDLSNYKSTKKMEYIAKSLDLDLTRKTQELSKGNRQKVGIVQAFMADQDLIILDEPTAGLDPLNQQSFYTIAKEAIADGKTIFMSSHVLAEVESICDRVGIIRDAKLKVVEDVHKLRDMMGKILEVEFHHPVDPKKFKLPGVSNIKVDDNKLTLTVTENIDDVIKKVADQKIINMNLKTFSLEQLFLKYYSDDGQVPTTNSNGELVEGGA